MVCAGMTWHDMCWHSMAWWVLAQHGTVTHELPDLPAVGLDLLLNRARSQHPRMAMSAGPYLDSSMCSGNIADYLNLACFAFRTLTV